MEDDAFFHLSSIDCQSWKRLAFGDDILSKKTVCRNEWKTRRKNQDRRAAQFKSRKICETLQSVLRNSTAQTIAGYLPIQGEVDLTSVLSQIIREGRTLALPCVEGGSMAMYRVESIENDTAAGTYGISEPVPERCAPLSPGRIDCFLVPGVAFDVFGGRIGQGGGFYDRFLAQKRQDAKTIGIAYAFQLLSAIACEETDCPVDSVVTEEGLFTPNVTSAICENELDTKNLARRLIDAGLQEGVLALHGNLGVGKTVFVQGICEACHAQRDASSPTFVFCHEYEGRIPIHHIDCYRMDCMRLDEEEFWLETIGQFGLVMIEWAERIGSILPRTAIHLFGSIEENGFRRWTLFTSAAEHQSLHEALSC